MHDACEDLGQNYFSADIIQGSAYSSSSSLYSLVRAAEYMLDLFRST
eukprot:COSAG05_NODE_188_length_14697_cov_11.861145_18_plen_47_part_00